MQRLASHRVSSGLWGLVTAVGVLIVILVLALQLIPRLDAGQDILDDAGPAFTDDRVARHAPAITIVSQITDLASPITTRKGTADAEVTKLVDVVAKTSGLERGAVLDAVEDAAPKTMSLLRALPLSDVSAELPGVVAFLARTLDVSEDELTATLRADFPRLLQTITALPVVTDGWDAVPGTERLTRFDGSPARDVPAVRDYFAKDVLPVVARQSDNFQDLQGSGGVGYVPYLLLALGGLVAYFGGMMLWSSRRGPMGRDEGMAMWGVVAGGGVIVLVLVASLSLFPRLNGGQELLDDAKPVFTDERIAGARAGIDMVSSIVDLGDPIATRRGGAADEVEKLVGVVAKETGLSADAVVTALRDAAPKTTSLLLALPLQDVAAEVPRLQTLLAGTLDVPKAQLGPLVEKEFPGLAQVLANVGPVTEGWNRVPGVGGLTRFDGTPVVSVPDVRAYFSGDVVAAVQARRDDFQKLESTAPPVDVFPVLLLVIGVVVTLLGVLMVLAFRASGTVTAPRGAPAGVVQTAR